MFSVGYRTIKTAIGAGIAIGIAQLLGLNFYISAGIITILCIKPTKKASLYSAWQRFIACLLAMVFAVIFFHILGYHPWTIMLVLILFIPSLVKLKAQDAVGTSSVIILQLYSLEKTTIGIIWNQFQVIVIGIGVALLINWYMPSVESKIIKYRKKIEDNFSIILKEFAVYLRKGDSDWAGKEIIETGDILKEAKLLSLKDIENHPFREKDSYYAYFIMREEQFEILERLMPKIASLDKTYKQGELIADFLERLSQKVSPKNTADVFLDDLEAMRAEFRESPLPKDRTEFEIRSALAHFVNEMESYLELKSQLKQPANSGEIKQLK
ncbi:aromatic acid exporter family protein [Scopulibacillus cellulosilyticus]|uniref:Aromatic acid exporter family protein n=1 Tax=Scopulibacillus cellulosilyticus TaxID=2665665 RepID=A0ABW2PYD0_9BACL